MPDSTTTEDDKKAPWWIQEARQYGVAIIFAGLLTVALKQVYEDNKTERAQREVKLEETTKQVTAVVDKNSAIINDFKISVDKNTEATARLETAVRNQQ